MSNKTLIITGGASGIGEAIVKDFCDRGFRVFNLDIQSGEYTHSNLEYIKCDVTKHNQVLDAVRDVAEHHDIEYVVSNAGIHVSANIENTSEEELMRVFDINVKGAFSLTQAVIPFMKEQGGSIVYIASEQSLVAKRNSFAYNLSKHALASIAKTTALDYASFKIRANALCPGTIETPLYHHAINRYCDKSGADKQSVHAEEAALQPLNRIGQAHEVAAFVKFLMSDDAAFVTGSLQVMDGGYTTQ